MNSRMTKYFQFPKFAVPVSICTLQMVLCLSAIAQDVERIEQREINRRQRVIPQGADALARGRVALEAKNYAVAHEEFRMAVVYLPDAVVAGPAHDQAVEGFCESGLRLAEQRIAEGKYAEAEATLREVLDPRFNPNCSEAKDLLVRLQTPGYFNRTMGPKFLAKVDEVKKLLTEAEGYYNSGRYDLAMKKTDQVLALDPYNTSARRWQEKIDNTKYRYNEEAYNETRARQLWQVEKGWEQPVRQYGRDAGAVTDAFQKDAAGTARITTKLNSIIIPRIEFRDASIREAIDFLRQQAAANDPSPEGRKGVDIVLRLAPLGSVAPAAPAPVVAIPPPAATAEGGAPPTAAEGAPVVATPIPAPAVAPPAPTTSFVQAVSPADARITITLNQIPLAEALRYIASQAGLKVKIEPYAVSVIPLSEQSADLLTKEYRVPPGFISSSVNVGASALSARTVTGGGTGKDTQETTGGRQLVNREGAKEFLEGQGVPFPPGASANFLPQSSRLIVRNTQDNLELVDALVEQASVSGPKQVEIESKFVEVTQNNLKELGFDWLLGQFNVPGSNRLFGGGGTAGTGPATSGSNFPFNVPGGSPVGQFPVTGGNRSGNVAISANAIDALLFPSMGASSLAPGIFGLAGVFTDPQFQVVVRALNQKKGVDLLSAPRVTTKSGQRAIIEIVREFRYPTQFQPPQIPQSFRSDAPATDPLATGLTQAPPVFPVTPTTPTAFETRNTGVTLEVEPVVGPDGVTIDLNLVPQVVEFEGFINYGSPINTFSTTLGVSTRQVITENVINQPIFSTRKVTTSVSVWDGQTVVLGGLMREDVQKTEDRTPIIGDIPLLGRLFRTNVDQHIKRNLVIFVTARLVTPGGAPFNLTEEEEEKESQIEPPALPEIPYYKK